MKKLIVVGAVLTALSAPAFAKTEGAYVGLDLLRNTAKVKSHSSADFDSMGNNTPFYRQAKNNSSYGVGLSYKYAFNFNNFFIAPALTLDYYGNDLKSSYGVSSTDYFKQTVKLNGAVSLKANIGYDLHDRFAVYIPFGISQFSYEIQTDDRGTSSRIISKKTGNKAAAFVGFGLSYEPVKNWVVNLEYNKYQNLNLTSATATFNNGNIIAKTNTDVVKFGLAYRF